MFANRKIIIKSDFDNKNDLYKSNKIIDETGSLDVLINNAGTNPSGGSLLDVDLSAVQKTWDVNLMGPLMWTREAVKSGLKESVLNVCSVGGIKPSHYMGAYNISKAADIMLVKNYALEFGQYNIRTNAIAPGLFKTDFARALWENPEIYAATVSKYPLRRIGEPDEIAGTAVLLASDAGRFTTGQTIVIDTTKPEAPTMNTITTPNNDNTPTITGTGTIAGTFTGDVTGNVTGDLTGTADKATDVVGAAGRVLYNSSTDDTTTSANLLFDGTRLSTNNVLAQNVKIAGAGANEIDTSSGNLILDAASNTVQVTTNLLVSGTTASTNKDSGALIVQGGVGIEKSLNVGNNLSVVGFTTLASAGGITTTGGDLYVGGDLFVDDDIVLDNIKAGSVFVSGLSTFIGLSTFNSGIEVVSGLSTFRGNVFVAAGATVGLGDSVFLPDEKKIIFGNEDDFSIAHDSIGYGGTKLINDSGQLLICLLYTSPSPRDRTRSRMPSSA